MPVMSGLSGNEMYCLGLKGFAPGELVIGNSVYSLGFLGSLGAENSLARLSFVGCICGLVVYFAGSQVLRGIAFPIAFLLFAIPIPVVVYNEIVFPLARDDHRVTQFLLASYEVRKRS